MNERQAGLFESQDAEQKREEAIERVRKGKDEYIVLASAALARLAATREAFTSDAVVSIVGKHEDEGRVLGAVFQDAQRSGLIRPTGRWVKSRDLACNARDKREWVGS